MPKNDHLKFYSNKTFHQVFWPTKHLKMDKFWFWQSLGGTGSDHEVEKINFHALVRKKWVLRAIFVIIFFKSAQKWPQIWVPLRKIYGLNMLVTHDLENLLWWLKFGFCVFLGGDFSKFRFKSTQKWPQLHLRYSTISSKNILITYNLRVTKIEIKITKSLV